MNARGKLAVDIVSYFFSVISPHTKDRGPFLVQQEVDSTKTVCLTIRPLHANASIGTPHHAASANSRDEAHARQLVSLQMLQHLESQGILPDDWWRWPPGWLNSAEPHVLRFLTLAHLLILKEHCWVARKAVIKHRISAQAGSVVLDTLLQDGSVVENSQQQVRLATAQETSLHQHAPRRQQHEPQQHRHAEAPLPRVAEPAAYQQQPYAAAAVHVDRYVAPYQQERLESLPPARYGRSSSRDEPYMHRRADPVTAQQQQAPYSGRAQQPLPDSGFHRDRQPLPLQAPPPAQYEPSRAARQHGPPLATSHDYGRAGAASHQPPGNSWQQQQQQQGPGGYQLQPYSPRAADRSAPHRQQQQQQTYSPRGYQQQPHQQPYSPNGYQQQPHGAMDYQQGERQLSYAGTYSQRSTYSQPLAQQPLHHQPVGYNRANGWQQEQHPQGRYQQQPLQGGSNSSSSGWQQRLERQPVPVGRYTQPADAYARPPPLAAGMHSRPEAAAASYCRPESVPPYAGFAGSAGFAGQQDRPPYSRDRVAPVGLYGSSHSSHLPGGRTAAAAGAGWPNERPMQQQQHWRGSGQELSSGSGREHGDRPRARDKAGGRGDRDSRGTDKDSRGGRNANIQQRDRPAGDKRRDGDRKDGNVPGNDKDGREKNGSSGRSKRQRQDEQGAAAASVGGAAKRPTHDKPSRGRVAAGGSDAAALARGRSHAAAPAGASSGHAAAAQPAASVALPPAVVLDVPQQPLTPRSLRHVVVQLLEAAAPFPVELDRLKQRFAAAAGAQDAAAPCGVIDGVLSQLQGEGAVELFAVEERQQVKQLARALRNGWSQQVQQRIQQQALQQAPSRVAAEARGEEAAAAPAGSPAADTAGDGLASMAVDAAEPAAAAAEVDPDAAGSVSEPASGDARGAAAHVPPGAGPASCSVAAVVPKYRKAAAAAAAAAAKEADAAGAAGSLKGVAAAASEAGAAQVNEAADSAAVLAA